ncbi:MAG: ATP-binding protein, partial [Methanosarcinales archaeon]
HEGVDPEAWRRQIDEAVQAAVAQPEIIVVVFVDELNTTSIMGMTKEVIVDGRLDGQLLPSNIFWVAAINPVRDGEPAGGGAAVAPAHGAAVAAVRDHTEAFTGAASHDDTNEYIVRELSPSLAACVQSVGSMTTQQEYDFLSAFLHDRGLGLNASLLAKDLPPEWFQFILSLITTAQKYVRNCGMMRVKVSIRDLMRTLQLYSYFLSHEGETFFFPSLVGQQTMTAKQRALERCWRALSLAVAVVYYLRLDVEHVDAHGGVQNLRDGFIAVASACMMSVDALNALSERLPFQVVLQQSLRRVFQATQVPTGIANTRTLQENVLACAVCFAASLPLIITGPPGCGKTLAMQIVLDNLNGASAVSQEYRALRHASRFAYQCSEASTASEIQAVYEGAKQRHDRFVRASINTERCVVCLDEASLPLAQRAALKVTHYYMDKTRDGDRPDVVTIMLTNRTLDAAKTNRGIQVLQSAPTTADLKALACGCLLTTRHKDAPGVSSADGGAGASVDAHTAGNVSHRPSEALLRQIDGLCSSFLEVPAHCDLGGRPNAFQLRDFIFFLRHLRRSLRLRASGDAPDAEAARIALAQNSFEISGDLLLSALRRNFNAISPERFNALASLFLTNCGIDPSTCGDRYARPQGGLLCPPEVLTSLREALSDTLEEGEDMNQCPYRHVMLIDKTDTESSLALLFDLGLLAERDVEFCHLAGFEEDGMERQSSELAARVKRAVEQGRTIILSNAQPVYSAFYDLFNQHYTVVNVASTVPTAAAGAAPRAANEEVVRRTQHMANIGIGALSRSCVVHPRAKVIVHVTRSQISHIPLPFLNRFEKYSLSTRHAVDERLVAFKREALTAGVPTSLQPELFYSLLGGMEHFVNFMGAPAFYGLVPQETTAALLLRCIQDTVATRSANPIVRSALHVRIALPSGSDDVEGDHLPSTPASSTHSKRRGASSLSNQLPLTEELDAGADSVATLLQAGTDPFTNMRAVIRRLNFQLMQYLRPEVLFMRHTSLPKAYVREYVVSQEHYSLANMVRGLMARHVHVAQSAAEDDTAPQPRNSTIARGHTSSWMVMMRTCGDLLRLKSSSLLQRSLLPSACDDDMELGRRITVLTLHTYSRSMDAEADLDHFFDQPLPSL